MSQAMLPARCADHVNINRNGPRMISANEPIYGSGLGISLAQRERERETEMVQVYRLVCLLH